MICKLLSRLYTFLHSRTYDRRRLSSRRFPEHYVISVGNLSAGGTGKTPVTIELAGRMMQDRRSVLVCLRGYKGSSKSGLLVADENGLYESADAVGDEAVLIALRLQERFAAGGQARFAVAAGSERSVLIERFGAGYESVLLDDAFQNPSVERDLEIVLIDATVPLRRLMILPCGRFREDLSALRRADVVLLTRTNLLAESAEQWKNEINRRYPSLPVFRLGIRSQSIVPLRQDKHVPDEFAAFCGIGNPESFFDVLEEGGLRLKQRLIFPDHHDFTEKELDGLRRLNMPLITTEKDAARLGARCETLPSLFVLRPEMFEMDESKDLWKRLTHWKSSAGMDPKRSSI